MSMQGATLAVPVGADDHSQGTDSATITLVEYGDYECPYCGEAFRIVRQLQHAFEDSLRFVFRNFPLANVHPHAEQAAELAEAVALQGRFWQVHDLLYENQQDLSPSALLRYAELAGADPGQAHEAVEAGLPRARVRRDLESGLRSGVNGTPTFFLNGARDDESWDYRTLAADIERLLRQP